MCNQIFAFFLNNKVLLYVPFEIKEDAKSMGAKWDSDLKSWYCDDDNQPCISEWCCLSYLQTEYLTSSVSRNK